MIEGKERGKGRDRDLQVAGWYNLMSILLWNYCLIEHIFGYKR